MPPDPSDQVTEWVNLHADTLLNRALFLLSNKEEAEDLVQEVFLTAFRSFKSFRGDSQPLTWLYSILNHKVADAYRLKYKSPPVIHFDRFFDQSGEWLNSIRGEMLTLDVPARENEKSLSSVLAHCLQLLPERWGVPFRLYYLNQKGAKNVCQEMGISATNFWKILQRSRFQLRDCLKENGFTHY